MSRVWKDAVFLLSNVGKSLRI